MHNEYIEVLSVTYRRHLTCSGCGTVGLGTRKLETGVFGCSLDEVATLVEYHDQGQSIDIPVGWASYGRGNVYCPKCKGPANTSKLREIQSNGS